MKGREATTTNNKMELSAAIAGLNALRPGAVVRMLGDSRYVTRAPLNGYQGGRQGAGRQPGESP